MITTEELFIIRDGERHKVDLSSPSGITLSYESNLFNSLDKVSCSHSYTIKLPKTTNNTRLFFIPQDIRSNKKEIRDSVDCEYCIDGVSLFRKGNAYVVNIDDYINIAITWDVIDSFKKINEDNFDLNEFDIKEDVKTGSVKQKVYENFINTYSDSYDNLSSTYRPLYLCGYGNVFSCALYGRRNPAKYSYPLPVVPVPYLIKRIENYYGIDLPIYSQQLSDGSSLTHVGNTEKTIDYGAIPCVSTKVRYDENEKNVVKLSRVQIYSTPDSLSEEGKIALMFLDVKFNGVTYKLDEIYTQTKETSVKSDFFEIGGSVEQSGDYVGHGFKSINSKSFLVRGHLRISVDGRPVRDSEGNIVEGMPTLSFYCMTPKSDEPTESSLECITSIDGNFVNVEGITNYPNHSAQRYITWYDFDLTPLVGSNYAMIEKLNEKFIVSNAAYKYGSYPFTRYVYPVLSTEPYSIDTENSYFELVPYWEEGDTEHEQDIIGNLPSVSVMDFLKSLFFMCGGYPKISKNGKLSVGKYTDILANIPNAYDWSDKILDDGKDKISFKIGNFKRKNWYLLANDVLPTEESEEYSPFDDPNEQKDEYEPGLCCIENTSDSEDGETTVIKLPWYGAYIKNGDYPSLPTGNTMKYWYVKYGELKLNANEAKPCYGVIGYNKFPFQHNKQDVYGLTMKVWNEFKNTDNENIKFLSILLKNPSVLTANVALNAFDLKDMDMNTPVFIDKYNSYFCIIKIERSSNGICKAELLRIPPEAL